MSGNVSTQLGIVPKVSGASQAAGQIGLVYQSLKAGTTTVKQANAAMQNYTGSIYSQRRAVMLIRMAYRNQHAVLFETMRLMSSVARLGRTMTYTFQAYTMMQIRVADANRDVRDTEGELSRVSQLRKETVDKLGSSNVHALNLMEQERQLSMRLVEEKRDLKRAQDQNVIGYVGIGLALLDVIPNVVDMMTHSNAIKELMGTSWNLTALTSLATQASTTKLAVAGISTTLGELALLAAIPIVTYYTIKVIKDVIEGSDYYIPPNDANPPGPANQGGIDLTALLDDILGSNLGGDNDVVDYADDPWAGDGSGSDLADLVDTTTPVIPPNPFIQPSDPFGPYDNAGFIEPGSALMQDVAGGGTTINQTNIITNKTDEEAANIIMDKMIEAIHEEGS